MESRYWLRLEGGADTGRVLPIPIVGLTVGRKPENSLVLADASVSGKHAELRVGADGVVLRDLGSTNGTFCDGQRVVEETLKHAAKLRFGAVQASFHDARLEPMPSASAASVPAKAATGASAPAPIRPRAPARTAKAEDEITLEEPELVESAGTASAGSEDDLSGTSIVPELARSTPDAGQAGEGLSRVSAERVKKSGGRSTRLVGAAALLLALGAGGALVWYKYFRRVEVRSTAKPVEALAGNLLPGAYSFEGEGGLSGWEALETAPQGFLLDAGAARSGKAGLAVPLAEGEWALTRSEPANTRDSRGLAFSGWLEARGQLELRLGLELFSSDGSRAPVLAWSKPLPSGVGFQQIELSVPVLPGCDRARAQVAARGLAGGGKALCDDLALLQVDAPAPAARFGEYQLFLLGEPATSAALVHLNELVFSGLACCDTSGSPVGYPRPCAELSVRGIEKGFALSFGPGLPGGAEPELALVIDAGIAKQGLATIGPAGYQARQREFEPTASTRALFGSGFSLGSLSWPEALQLAGQPVEGGYRLSARKAGSPELSLLLSFKDERVEAQRLGQEARAAKKAGDLGGCLAHWKALLDGFPYEAALVAEAESTRAQLVQKGLEEVRVLEQELERGSFFALADLFRQCEQKALVLGRRYLGSEVAAAADAVVQRAQSEIAACERGSRAADAEKLRAILATLPDGASGLLSGEIGKEIALIPQAPPIPVLPAGSPGASPPPSGSGPGVR